MPRSRRAARPAPSPNALRATNAVTADQLTRALAVRLGMDYADLSEYKPELAAANMSSAGHTSSKRPMRPISVTALTSASR